MLVVDPTWFFNAFCLCFLIYGLLFSLASVKESNCGMSKMVVVQDDWRAYNVCVNARFVG